MPSAPASSISGRETNPSSPMVKQDKKVLAFTNEEELRVSVGDEVSEKSPQQNPYQDIPMQLPA
jgi:hypothetical protein